MSCPHLAEFDLAGLPEMPNVVGCPECVAAGNRNWVHLRQCLTCGNVGCCDSSARRHASEHYAETGHPVMRSIERGEHWRWCYVHEALG